MAKKRLMVLLAMCLLISAAVVYAGRRADKASKADPMLHIDIPVKLESANVVLNIDRDNLLGDSSIAIGHLNLLAMRFGGWNTKGQVIGLFHTEAGYMTLDDGPYNAERNVTTGNPYKSQLVELMKHGVQIELCGATAAFHHWSNSEIIPGIKVNTDAMVRLTQLHEQGYAEIKE
ncbi:MAG TPA: DsrE family protein [Blastocatellia bacterium]